MEMKIMKLTKPNSQFKFKVNEPSTAQHIPKIISICLFNFSIISSQRHFQKGACTNIDIHFFLCVCVCSCRNENLQNAKARARVFRGMRARALAFCGKTVFCDSDFVANVPYKCKVIREREYIFDKIRRYP